MDIDLSATLAIKLELIAVVSTLPDMERDILTSRFGLGDEPSKSLKDIGAMFNITGSKVRQLEAKALKLMTKKPQKLKGCLTA